MFPLHLRSHGRPHLFRDPGCDLVIPVDSLGAWCGAVWNKKTRAQRNKYISLDLVTASYKIKAREASPTTRRKLSAQQLYTRHGWARERQLGTMVDTQFLFALLWWRSRSSNQTMSWHRVSYYYTFQAFTFILYLLPFMLECSFWQIYKE